jgi:hypothetical protein
MSDHILTLAKAKLFVEYPELYRLFWKDWNAITMVEYEALEYLVKFSSSILLPNVKELSPQSKKILKSYSGGLIIGVQV